VDLKFFLSPSVVILFSLTLIPITEYYIGKVDLVLLRGVYSIGIVVAFLKFLIDLDVNPSSYLFMRFTPMKKGKPLKRNYLIGFEV
jgi:hypothetical protein